MRQNTVTPFKGTVAELAGKITFNGEVLNQQEVQFLTRIGRNAFAKPVGTARGAGTKGGKRATIWEINPNAKLTLAPVEEGAGAANDEVPASTAASLPNDVQAAVQKVLSDPAMVQQIAQVVVGSKSQEIPEKRKPGRPKTRKE